MKIDELDVRIVQLFSEDSGIGVLAASRALGVAAPLCSPASTSSRPPV